MESIKDRVAIIGMGCTKFGELWDKSVEDLIVEAAKEAFEDAGIQPRDVQAAWVGTVDSGITAITLSSPLKLQYIPVTRVENMCATGAEALRGAVYAVAAGACDIALAVGVEKLKDTGWSGAPDANVVGCSRIGVSGTEPACSAPSVFAMLANRYFHHFGIDPEQGKRYIAQIAVKNHYNGSLNPKAHYQREITMEQVMNAPIVAWPFGVFDCCGVSDGAAAAIVTRADMARNFREDPIYIKAMALSAGARQAQLKQDYDYVHVEESVISSKRAYAEAGIKNPRKELNIAEVHDCFTFHEMCLYEDLGWCDKGKAWEDIEAGTFRLKGELPVNTDGGLKCFGHPIGASGLRMMYEVYKQLQGKAGLRQVKNPQLGLTHTMGGIIGAAVVSCVIVGNQKG
ncbi:MAG: acetyl-CoA acetyltransferase [Dethiobacter sp.]|jgi:acetyl-CoA C-acetyltransferase|nr:MAG: acetyl-CoA acetyltransferase [Dethiobacter sp.]